MKLNFKQTVQIHAERIGCLLYIIYFQITKHAKDYT